MPQMMNRFFQRKDLKDRDAQCEAFQEGTPFSASSWFEPYLQKDECLYIKAFRLEAGEAAQICSGARTLVHSLFSCPNFSLAGELTGRWKMQICREVLPIAGGRLIFLGECFGDPPRIVVFPAAIEKCASALAELCLPLDPAWFRTEMIEKAVLAHELYHLMSRAARGKKTELAAHCFAREALGLPFSPLLFESALKRKQG